MNCVSTFQIGSGMATYGDLMADFEDSLLKEKSSRASGSLLKRSKEIRNQSLIHSRLTELEGNCCLQRWLYTCIKLSRIFRD